MVYPQGSSKGRCSQGMCLLLTREQFWYGRDSVGLTDCEPMRRIIPVHRLSVGTRLGLEAAVQVAAGPLGRRTKRIGEKATS